MSKKALVSFAIHNHESLLEIAINSFYRYSTTHQYDLIIPSTNYIKSLGNFYNINLDRPPSWWKIPLIINLLTSYEIVLWIDADVIINKYDIDISNFIKNTNYIQAFTVHHTCEGYIPNCGVWMLQRESQSLLVDIWNKTEYINHCWWEQKANMDLMGWNQYLSIQNNLSEYGQRSLELPYEWNMHRADYRYNSQSEEDCRFLHSTSYDNRLNTMIKWRKQNELG